jgi:thiol-disulfide isomerase/thioredoxin
MRPLANAHEFIVKNISKFTQAYTSIPAKDLDDPNYIPPPPLPAPGEKLMKDTLTILSVNTLDGKPYSLNQVGGKLILMDFWFANCAPCIKAMPGMEAISKKYASKGLKVIGVDPYDFEPAGIKEVLQKNGVDYPVYMDDNSAIAKDIGILMYPTVLLIDPKSKRILQSFTSSDATKDLPAAIEKYLKRK